ncbi:hypothetical protein [Azohydromonas lata]|nr:hypothetical protein [Azohydromonas lata]
MTTDAGWRAPRRSPFLTGAAPEPVPGADGLRSPSRPLFPPDGPGA